MPNTLLINPNTNNEVTERMLAAARRAQPANVSLEAVTARYGARAISTPEHSACAAQAVLELLHEHAPHYRGAIIAAFTDPGLDQARDRFDIPVFGIAESAMLEAASGDRRFSVVTLGAKTHPGVGTRPWRSRARVARLLLQGRGRLARV